MLTLFLVACDSWGWEAIDTDNQEHLNIFGLISLDDSLKSFIVVHKTLDTAGPEDHIIGYDTTYYEVFEWYHNGVLHQDTSWYEPPYIRPVRESLFVVKDATVIVSDGTEDYVFVRSPQASEQTGMFWDSGNIFADPGIYINVDNRFSPQPNRLYTLDITTPNGHHVRGTLTTPAMPQIREEALDDTLSLHRLYDVSWEYTGDFNTTISTGKLFYDWEEYICGMDQFDILEPGDTTWTSSIDSWCLNQNPDPDRISTMDIRLRFLDENYYRYFLASNKDGDISNFLIGTGSIGTAYGLEGGVGVFGALSADWVTRYVTP